MANRRILKELQTHFTGAPPEVEERISQLIAELPPPVLWLLGKTQSGKSSIVRALTGVPKIEIGQGYKPCTTTAHSYAFPDDEQPLLYFLDTRGLFEPGYDAAEDIAFFEDNAHLLLVVLKATDHSVDALSTQLKLIKKRHPEWPTILVQTNLHEAYPVGIIHPTPYPFADLSSLPPELKALSDQLQHQRRQLSGLFTEAVAVDFTLPEDGLAPQDYGREALIAALERNLPEVAWNLIRVHERAGISGAYLREAHGHIAFYSALAAGAAASPLPFADLPVITALQVKMLHSVAHVYSQPLSYERFAEVAGTIGLGYLSRLGWRALMKLVPGGSIAYAAYSGAVTYALGMAFCAYFDLLRQGTKPDPETLRRIFRESMLARERSTRNPQ